MAATLAAGAQRGVRHQPSGERAAELGHHADPKQRSASGGYRSGWSASVP